jgi:hypothetical protein
MWPRDQYEGMLSPMSSRETSQSEVLQPTAGPSALVVLVVLLAGMAIYFFYLPL